jgi:hypothetical protein
MLCRYNEKYPGGNNLQNFHIKSIGLQFIKWYTEHISKSTAGDRRPGGRSQAAAEGGTGMEDNCHE